MKRWSFLILFVLLPFVSQAQFDESLLENFTWRSVGPAGAGGRVVDVEVVGEFPYHIFVATASGGLWRSTNNGVTWEPIFDDQTSVSIGAIAVHPGNPDIIWVGTGEANARNSVSWGDGVYKSTDGGKSWKNMGLRDTHHIGRVILDPRAPDTVYVAALGHIWGANEERGLYKTTDGGESWEKSLEIDADTGVIDVAMDPFDSGTLYAAAYEVRRDGFSGGDPRKMTGPGSGLYKSADAGRSWKKLAEGLPEGDLGRIGLTVSRSNPSVVYSIIQTETTVAPSRDPDEPPPPRKKKTAKDGGVFRSNDRGETWEWMNAINPRPFYYSQIRVDPNDENRVYVLGSPLEVSEDGGKSFERLRINVHVDHHDLWINPADSKHLVLGNDGGVYFSYDRGRTWDFLNQMAIGQFYAIDVDMRTPYNIYGGVQDYCSWGGPSATRNRIGIAVSDWSRVMTGDGFQVRIDPTDPDLLYAEMQYGGIIRHDKKTGQNTSIKPEAPEGEEDYRFNWETPLHISYHDPKTLYVGGNHVFRSRDQGQSWEVLSPDLTTETDSWPDYKDGEPQMIASTSALAESPLEPDLIYAGTDDGHVWVTTDGGGNWTEITDKFPGLPGARWVSRLVASRFDKDRAYATFDGHRNDDFAPYVFVTADAGQSWKSIVSNLPNGGSVRVIREDVKNPNLLFVGTELAAFVSLNRGAKWLRLMNGMPTVAVADLVVHPRDGDLIAGTHGRSAYVMDISPLQELAEDVLAKDLHLFRIEKSTAFRYRVYTHDEFLGEKKWIAENPPFGVTISYLIGKEAAGTPTDSEDNGDEGEESEKENVKILVTDTAGKTVRELEGPLGPGLHRVQWDLRHEPPEQDEVEADSFRGPLEGPLVRAGVYQVSLQMGDAKAETMVIVEEDPELRITQRDLEKRWQTLDRLLPLQGDIYRKSKTSRSLQEQLEKLETSLDEHEELPEELGETAKSLVEEAKLVSHRMSRLNSDITRLYRAVENSPFVPTQMQLDALDGLESRYREQNAELGELEENRIPDFEKQLNEHQVPRIQVGSDVKK
jgi:photosystem II stability/assembly factor-like uncharacterized protein